MEFLANEIEIKNLANNPLTELNESGTHYVLKPQRGCFLRCMDCFNLSEADSFQAEGGKWHFKPECYFCVQRVIDLLGYLEHGKVPRLVVSGDRKERTRRGDGGFYEAIMRAVEAQGEDSEPISDVFDDCVGGEG